MGEGEAAATLGAAEFQHDDRDALTIRALHRGDEAVGRAHGFHQAGDHPRFGRGEQEVDVVRHRGGDFLAGGDGVVEHQVALVADQARPGGAAVRDEADRSGSVAHRRRVRGHLDAVDGIEIAHTVVATDRHAGGAGDRGQACDAGRAGGGWFVGAAEQHRGAHAGRCGIGQSGFDQVVGDGERRAIGRCRQRGEAGVAAQAGDFLVAGIDRIDRAAITTAGDRVQQAQAEGAFAH